jgi:hypothetical protein
MWGLLFDTPLTFYKFIEELWIRGGVNADPDPAFFYLSAYPDPGSQTHADPDTGPTFPSQKVEFLHENIMYVGNMSSKTYLRVISLLLDPDLHS